MHRSSINFFLAKFHFVSTFSARNLQVSFCPEIYNSRKIIIFQVVIFIKFHIKFNKHYFYLHRLSIFLSVLELLRMGIRHGNASQILTKRLKNEWFQLCWSLLKTPALLNKWKHKVHTKIFLSWNALSIFWTSSVIWS